MIKYFAVVHFNSIRKVEAERETDASVWINGRRNAKMSNSDAYFNSFSEAKQWLIDKQRTNVELYKYGLDIAVSRLKEIEALEEK